MTRFLAKLNVSRPVNWSHPLAKSQVMWLLHSPDGFPYSSGGKRVLDLCGFNNVNTVTVTAVRGVTGNRQGGWGSWNSSFSTISTPRTQFTSSANPELTCGAWTYRPSNTELLIFANWGGYPTNNYYVRTTTTNGFALIQANDALNIGSFIIPSGVWVHLTVRRTGSSGAWRTDVFVNGKLATGLNHTINPAGGSYPYLAGISTANHAVDDVFAYARGLTDSEIMARYKESLYGYPTLLNRTNRRYFYAPAATGGVSTLIPVLDGEMFSGGFQTMTGGLA